MKAFRVMTGWDVSINPSRDLQKLFRKALHAA